MPAVELLAVTKRFGRIAALDRFSVAVEPGECVCLFGPSGCGKTTALRIAAGFEVPDAGAVRIHGAPATDNGVCVPPAARGIGMVFQDLALWPHMRAARHLDFVLRPTRPSRPERRARVAEMLQLCGMSDRARAYPHELSGGQQQRLAIARALAPRPRILLLDEPFSGLDEALRARMRSEILRLKNTERVAVLLATHDREELAVLADRVLQMLPCCASPGTSTHS